MEGLGFEVLPITCVAQPQPGRRLGKRHDDGLAPDRWAKYETGRVCPRARLQPCAGLIHTKRDRVGYVDGANKIQGLARRDIRNAANERSSPLGRNGNNWLSLQYQRCGVDLRRRYIPKCVNLLRHSSVEEVIAGWIRLIKPRIAAAGGNSNRRKDECQEAERTSFSHRFARPHSCRLTQQANRRAAPTRTRLKIRAGPSG